MAQVSESVDVHAPISRVYNMWTQFESFPNFMGGVESITQMSDTMTHWKVKIAGVEREFDAEIVEQKPDERVAWKSDNGEHAGVVTFHRLSDDDTRVNVQLDWEPENFLEKLGSVFQVDDIQIKGDVKRFKKLAEETGGESDGWRGEVDRAPDATGN